VCDRCGGVLVGESELVELMRELDANRALEWPASAPPTDGAACGGSGRYVLGLRRNLPNVILAGEARDVKLAAPTPRPPDADDGVLIDILFGT